MPGSPGLRILRDKYFLVLLGGNPDEFLEKISEVALIRKSRLVGSFQWFQSFFQQQLGLVDAHRLQIPVGGNSLCFCKSPH